MTKEQKKKDEPTTAIGARDPLAELRDFHPFGVGFPLRSGHLLRGDWPWASARHGWEAPLDVNETDDLYAVTVELPGARKEDVTVEFRDGLLTIRGEKKSERSESEKRRFAERRYGTFSRSFSLPSDADGDHIEAAFQDGILTLTIPKIEAAKPRTVAIQ